MRIQLFEFEDQKWFPEIIRSGGTDFLRYLFKFLRFYHPAAFIIKKGLQNTLDKNILDLCSGGGGPVETISEELGSIKISLSDLYPNINAFEFLKEKSRGRIDYISSSVNAIDSSIPGFRTMFSAIHHFQPIEVKAVLQNAVNNNAGIAIFDGGNKNAFSIIALLIFHPIAFLIATPFFRPFRFSRLLLTYIIPLIPLYTIWDGCVSILRLYSPEELLELADETNTKNYQWQSGKLKSSWGLKVTYLIGYPKKSG